MKRIDKIKKMQIDEFVDWLFYLDLCDVCIEVRGGISENCWSCNIKEEKEMYKEWLEMEI